jgi:hypothetical protein
MIIAEEVEETVAGCYSEHMIGNTWDSSCSVKKEILDMATKNYKLA